MELLRALLSGVSSLRPGHTLAIGGEVLPLEARMGGIFLGFLLGVGYLALLGRLRASRPPAGPARLACWALLGWLGLDGLNAFLFDGGLPHLYPPSTALRLATGLAGGHAVALLALPVAAGAIWQEPRDEPAILDMGEVAAGLAAAALLGALLLIDVPPLLWPVALAMLASVLVGFGIGNFYLLARWVGRVRARCWGDLVGPGVSALGLALVELAALAVLRAFLASLGWQA